MKQNLKHFNSSIIITFLGLLLAYFLGGLAGMTIVLILAILEISLSFDNAIVNAKVLNTMSEKWRKRFLTWGMVIAVFGMRLIFPIVIVAIVSHLSPWSAIILAINKPDEYSIALESAKIVLAGFGGSFLLMVFLKFFVDFEKEIHWIAFIEKQLARFAKLESIEIIFTLILLFIISKFLNVEDQLTFLIAGIFGLVIFLFVKGIEGILEKNGKQILSATTQAGFATFIYLEILDASFSFDGVIGAFALSKNIFIIMIGLGIGAMFVRSLTMFFVEKKTLSNFVYIEHGAFWAIGFLAIIILVSCFYSVPEIITGLIGAVLICFAVISSIANKKVNNKLIDSSK